jgi:GNAT superfamily N-acetyltransferase
MNYLNKWQLTNEFSIVQLEALPGDLAREQAKKYLGPEYPMLPKHFGVEQESIKKLNRIKGRLIGQFTLRLGLLHKNDLIGWTDGWQDSIEQDTFFMGASLVVPAFQKKGLYSALVKKVFEITKAEGFQSISSLHIMTNNPVLIAKLKLGFSIYGFEVNTRYGALVRLIFHHNEMKKNALHFRAGALNQSLIFDALKKG